MPLKINFSDCLAPVVVFNCNFDSSPLLTNQCGGASDNVTTGSGSTTFRITMTEGLSAIPYLATITDVKSISDFL